MSTNCNQQITDLNDNRNNSASLSTAQNSLSSDAPTTVQTSYIFFPPGENLQRGGHRARICQQTNNDNGKCITCSKWSNLTPSALQRCFSAESQFLVFLVVVFFLNLMFFLHQQHQPQLIRLLFTCQSFTAFTNHSLTQSIATVMISYYLSQFIYI